MPNFDTVNSLAVPAYTSFDSRHARISLHDERQQRDMSAEYPRSVSQECLATLHTAPTVYLTPRLDKLCRKG